MAPVAERPCAHCGRLFRPPRGGQLCSKTCNHAAWVAANREKVLADHRAWYVANRERLREEGRQRRAATPAGQRYYAVNSKKINERIRHRRATDPEWAAKERAYRRAWDAANRRKVRGYVKKWTVANRQKVRDADRRRRLARMLKTIPNDPFVRDIMVAMFDIRSKAMQASHAHLRLETTCS